MRRASTAASPVVHDDYLHLIRRFPLRPLRSDDEHAAAGAVIDRLMGRDDLTEGERDYLAAIVRFVADYESRRTAAWLGKLGPIDVLKHLMRENEMNTTDLGYILGSRGLASEVLTGKRALSKTLIRKLSQRFHVSPSLFFSSADEQP